MPEQLTAQQTFTAQVTAIATRVAKKVGFPYSSVISIITIALPLISQLMEGCGGVKASKRVATNHWDEETSEFDSRAIKKLRPEMRQATRAHNHKTGENLRPTKSQLDAMAIEALRQAKDEPAEQVAACMTTAASMPVETDDDGE